MQNSKITKLKARRAKQHRLVAQERHTQEIEALSDVKASIKDLYSLINDQEKFDHNKLTEQLETLTKTIDIKEQIDELKSVIQKAQPNIRVEQMNVEELLKAIKANKPQDLTEVHKALIEIRQRVQESSVVEQAPEDFQPVRRVVKVGNRLIFDDQPTTATRAGGGGSGGSSSGGLTNEELRASPIDVNSAVYTTRIDEASETVTYIGDASVGSATSATVWRIKKLDTSSGTAITFAEGDGNFDKEWDERAGYSYS